MAISIPTFADIQAAARRIAPLAHRTPVMTCESLDRMLQARLFFKCENLQKAGAFKFRGAHNAVSCLSESEARRGVVTHSSGNHAAALALAARYRAIPAHIIMPRNAPAAKRAAVESYGAHVILCEPTLAARESTAAQTIDETGGVLVHPYDDPRVIAGQGTVALELIEQQPGLDMIIAPISGGGLLSGIAIAACGASPKIEVVGAEPEQADDAARSIASGTLLPAGPSDTIADGLRAGLSERTFVILKQHVRRVATTSEQQIATAMRLIWERLKIVVEPSGAVPMAAVMADPAIFQGRRVGVVLSGGNLDLDRLPWQ